MQVSEDFPRRASAGGSSAAHYNARSPSCAADEADAGAESRSAQERRTSQRSSDPKVKSDLVFHRLGAEGSSRTHGDRPGSAKPIEMIESKGSTQRRATSRPSSPRHALIGERCRRPVEPARRVEGQVRPRRSPLRAHILRKTRCHKRQLMPATTSSRYLPRQGAAVGEKRPPTRRSTRREAEDDEEKKKAAERRRSRATCRPSSSACSWQRGEPS